MEVCFTMEKKENKNIIYSHNSDFFSHDYKKQSLHFFFSFGHGIYRINDTE